MTVLENYNSPLAHITLLAHLAPVATNTRSRTSHRRACATPESQSATYIPRPPAGAAARSL